MWSALSGGLMRGLLRNRLFLNLLRGLGGAVVAGIGWKLGGDAYDAAKKRFRERPRADQRNETGEPERR